MDKQRYLIKNIRLFSLALLLPRSLSFFMVPLYTSQLSPAEYGTADILHLIVILLLPVLTLQIQDAVLRFSVREEYARGDVLMAGTAVITVGGAVLLSIYTVLWLLGYLRGKEVFFAFILLNYFIEAFSAVLSYFCRGIDAIRQITVASIVHSVLNIVCNLLFLLVFHWGLWGYLSAMAIGGLVSNIYIFAAAGLGRYASFRLPKREVFAGMLRISIPMIAGALSWWINSASDKFILKFYAGAAAVGLYAVAGKLPTVLSLGGEVIAKAFSISAIKEYDPEDRDGFLGNSYEQIRCGMLMSASVLILFTPMLSAMLFSGEFYDAVHFVPPLILAAYINQMAWTCENLYLAMGNTKAISATAVLGAFTNICLNFLLIPYYGAFGAAVATALGFLVVWLLRYCKLRKLTMIRFHFIKEGIGMGILTLQALLPQGGSLWVGIQLACTIVLGIAHRQEMVELLKVLKKV